MPEHEYLCSQGHVFLVRQSITDEVNPTVSCPICGEPAKYHWATKQVAGKVEGGTGGGRKLQLNQKKKERNG